MKQQNHTKKRIKKGGSGFELTNSEWKYKKSCQEPQKICSSDTINFALCVDNEEDCENPNYDYHFNPRTSKIEVNNFNVDRFKVVPKEEGLSEKEREEIHNDALKQELIGRFKNYSPEFTPTSCFIQKKPFVMRSYPTIGNKNVIPKNFRIVTQNALGLYFGKPEDQLDLTDPKDLKNKAILNIMRLRTAYFRKFLQDNDYPDFLCFQEMTSQFLNFLYNDKMKEVYPFVYPDQENFNELMSKKAEAITTIISKYPAIKQTTYMLQGNSSYYNSLGVYEFKNVVIFNVYLQAGSKFSPGLKYNWENYSRCRRQQLIFIKSLIDSYANSKAVIVLGDFNFELNSIHYDGTPDDLENWSESKFLKDINLDDSFKTLHPEDLGLTENTEINTLRFLGKLEHKALRYDGIFFNNKLTPIDSKIVNNIPLKLNDQHKNDLEIPFNPQEINGDYELALVFRPGGQAGDELSEKLERYKHEKNLLDGYELFVSDHFGVMTHFRLNESSGGKRKTKRIKNKKRKKTKKQKK